MEDRGFIQRHYEVLTLAGYLALMAGIIFFMAMPRILQIGLLVVSAVFFLPMLRSRASTSEPPCGGDLSGEGIARPRPGFKP